jgi:hypothetical protein
LETEALLVDGPKSNEAPADRLQYSTTRQAPNQEQRQSRKQNIGWEMKAVGREAGVKRDWKSGRGGKVMKEIWRAGIELEE